MPILAVGAGIDNKILSLESDLGQLQGWNREDWKDLIRGLHNPLSKDSLRLSSSERRAAVGGQLAELLAPAAENPEVVATVIASASKYPFRENNLLLVEELMGYVFSRRIPVEGGYPSVEDMVGGLLPLGHSSKGLPALRGEALSYGAILVPLDTAFWRRGPVMFQQAVPGVLGGPLVRVNARG